MGQASGDGDRPGNGRGAASLGGMVRSELRSPRKSRVEPWGSVLVPAASGAEGSALARSFLVSATAALHRGTAGPRRPDHPVPWSRGPTVQY